MRAPVLLLAASVIAAGLYAQKAKDNPNDWPMYTRDLAGTRFSPLEQINTGNVSKLAEAWTYKISTAAPARGGRGAAAPPQEGAAVPGPADAAAAGGNGDFAAAAAAPTGGRGGGGANPEATPIVVNG